MPKLQTDQNLIYEQVKFQYPYSKIRLSNEVIEEIQVPIKVSPTDIQDFLKFFALQFPKSIIPSENKDKTILKITEKDITETFKVIQSELMC